MKAFNHLLLILILTSCSNSENGVSQTEISNLADDLSSFDSVRIGNVTTSQGYKSIQRWSSDFEDSSAFLLWISERLHSRDYKIEMEDSTLYKIVFENHDQPMLGPDGALMVRVDSNDHFLIDEYRGGK